MNKIFTLLFVLVLSACSVVDVIDDIYQDDVALETSGVGTYKIGNPYQVNGVWYYPAENFDYDEIGWSSWYGDEFHGKLTANGEIFDRNALTAAHKTLPLPSIVRVTNLENNRSVVVRVNDRGPFVGDRVIDVSHHVSKELDFEHTGLARVRVQVLERESRMAQEYAKKGIESPTEFTQAATLNAVSASVAPMVAQQALPMRQRMDLTQSQSAQPATPYAQPQSPYVQQSRNLAPQNNVAPITSPEPVVQPQSVAAPVYGSGIRIQTGAFTMKANAEKQAQILSSYGSATVEPAFVDGQRFYRVRVGPIENAAEAEHLRRQLMNGGFPESRLIFE